MAERFRLVTQGHAGDLEPPQDRAYISNYLIDITGLSLSALAPILRSVGKAERTER
jgi:hypothetical protein